MGVGRKAGQIEGAFQLSAVLAAAVPDFYLSVA